MGGGHVHGKLEEISTNWLISESKYAGPPPPLPHMAEDVRIGESGRNEFPSVVPLQTVSHL